MEKDSVYSNNNFTFWSVGKYSYEDGDPTKIVNDWVSKNFKGE